MVLWERVLNQEPRNQNILSRLGDAMLRLEHHERAEEYYRRSLAVGFDLYSMLGGTRRISSNSSWSSRAPRHPDASQAGSAAGLRALGLSTPIPFRA